MEFSAYVYNDLNWLYLSPSTWYTAELLPLGEQISEAEYLNLTVPASVLSMIQASDLLLFTQR